MYTELANLLIERGYAVTDDIRFYLGRLIECLDAQNIETDVLSVLAWLEDKRKNYHVDTEEIRIKDVERWKNDPNEGNISHESGKFFSVIGVRVKGAKGREVESWSQPMIKQQECGILGILCKNIKGVRHYLLYAKFEPGNTEKIQLSPTLQATESNLKRAHGGKKPLFAEYFEDGGRGRILASVVSVEDGGRFYMKTNRNMIVEVSKYDNLEIPEDYIWVTLPQIKKLLKEDNVVNSLVRSVLGSW